MRVLHVLAPAPYGGLESVVQSLAHGLQQRSIDVHIAAVITPDHNAESHPFLQACRNAGATVHTIRLPGRAYLQERAAIAELCARLQPAVVHTHGYRADLIAASAARAAGRPTVTTVHGFTGGGWRNRLYEHVQRRAFRSFDAVIAVSRKLHEQLSASGVSEQRLHVIQNAWAGAATALDRTAARTRLGLQQNVLWIGWVGRLSHEKGPDVLLDAMPSLPDTVHCAFVGDGPLLQKLTERAQQLGVTDRVRFTGRVDNAAALARAFDCFVLSSRTEGTPIALFEAMAAEVPIVATAVGGVPDVVDDSCAALVASEQPEQIARAVRQTIENGNVAQRVIEARNRLQSRFGSGPWAGQHQQLYAQLSS